MIDMKIKEYLKEQRLIPDGSMGTYYSSIVNQPGAISEYANLTSPAIIEQIHKDYLTAGARMLRTNTFAANRAVLHMNIEEQKELVKAACLIAKKAVQESNTIKRDRTIWILGDIGPIPEDADTKESEVFEEYCMLCDMFIEEGMDGIHFETFSNLHYIEKLVPYIKEKKADMFVMTSFSVNKNGYTGGGISAARLMDKVSQMDGIDGCGLNCGVGSGHMYQILKKVSFPEKKFIYAAPNAGYPEQMQNRMIFMDNAEYFAGNMKLIAELGVDILGGCCGTTPEYIADLTKTIDVKEHVSSRRKHQPDVQDRENLVKGNDFFQLLQSGKKVIAVELDPPYDANIDQVMECAHVLKASGANMITFADSPMGRSRVDSILMSIKIAEETGLNVMPHVCCRDRNMISMRSSLLGAYIHGIRNLLIVTGDPVPGESRVSTTGVFDYNSIQLMDYVKEMNVEHFAKEPIYYGGALNQSRGLLEKVVERMKRKIDAGAEYFLTQPIYSLEDVERIRSIKKMVDTKILCGIMPLVSYRNACFIKNEISGIHVPEEIVDRYRPDMSREEAENVGAAIAREIMELLDPIADGYYFMLPFNRVSLMDKIIQRN
jgi:methionine synthase I (cobalamin-dependent)/5,10-methylenetetrahydrofolate reductase